MEKLLVVIGIAAFALAMMFGVSLILALPVMFLWNWTMPEIFLLPRITFVQAWMLLLLSNILFKTIATTKQEK